MSNTDIELVKRVNALSGLYLIVTQRMAAELTEKAGNVSMPSRAYTSLLRRKFQEDGGQCRISVNALSGLYLIVTRNV